MFTGLVEEVGKLQSVRRGARSCVLTVACNTVTDGTHIGDSIMTNGVCLTVTKVTCGSFSADVMPETLRRSALGALHPGDAVNLERAMPASGRFGGHIVSGHIDGTGTIRSLQRDDNAVWITVAAGPEILRYVVEKGSVALDGISLTAAGVDQSSLRVSVIPHTWDVTALKHKRPGNLLNVECDIIGKYVEKMLKTAES